MHLYSVGLNKKKQQKTIKHVQLIPNAAARILKGKLINGLESKYISELLVRYASRALRSPQLWSKLPAQLRYAEAVSLFKSGLKMLYIS